MLTIDKKRSIGLASKEVGVQEHVIRFWETQFPEYISPTIGAGGRRYFFDKDIKVLLFIKNYLYDKGYTIKGLQNLLKTQNLEFSNNENSEKNNNKIYNDVSYNKKIEELDKSNNISKIFEFREDLIKFYNKLKNI